MHKGAGKTAHGSATQYRYLYTPEFLPMIGDLISDTVRMLTRNKRETGRTADQHRPADDGT